MYILKCFRLLTLTLMFFFPAATILGDTQDKERHLFLQFINRPIVSVGSDHKNDSETPTVRAFKISAENLLSNHGYCNIKNREYYSNAWNHLVLSGGVTKGFAHIGAINVFEDLGINIDSIAGTSIGALVGAFHSVHTSKSLEALLGLGSTELTAEDKENYKHVSDIEFDDLLKDKPLVQFENRSRDSNKYWNRNGKTSKRRYYTNGIRSAQSIHTYLQRELFAAQIVTNGCFLDLQSQVIPISTNYGKTLRSDSTNNNNSLLSILTTGNLARNVRASLSFPIIFTPEYIEGDSYRDGGILANLPLGKRFRPILNDDSADTRFVVIGVDTTDKSPVKKVNLPSGLLTGTVGELIDLVSDTNYGLSASITEENYNELKQISEESEPTETTEKNKATPKTLDFLKINVDFGDDNPSFFDVDREAVSSIVQQGYRNTWSSFCHEIREIRKREHEEQQQCVFSGNQDTYNIKGYVKSNLQLLGLQTAEKRPVFPLAIGKELNAMTSILTSFNEIDIESLCSSQKTSTEERVEGVKLKLNASGKNKPSLECLYYAVPPHSTDIDTISDLRIILTHISNSDWTSYTDGSNSNLDKLFSKYSFLSISSDVDNADTITVELRGWRYTPTKLKTILERYDTVSAQRLVAESQREFSTISLSNSYKFTSHDVRYRSNWSAGGNSSNYLSDVLFYQVNDLFSTGRFEKVVISRLGADSVTLGAVPLRSWADAGTFGFSWLSNNRTNDSVSVNWQKETNSASFQFIAGCWLEGCDTKFGNRRHFYLGGTLHSLNNINGVNSRSSLTMFAYDSGAQSEFIQDSAFVDARGVGIAYDNGISITQFTLDERGDSYWFPVETLREEFNLQFPTYTFANLTHKFFHNFEITDHSRRGILPLGNYQSYLKIGAGRDYEATTNSYVAQGVLAYRPIFDKNHQLEFSGSAGRLWTDGVLPESRRFAYGGELIYSDTYEFETNIIPVINLDARLGEPAVGDRFASFGFEYNWSPIFSRASVLDDDWKIGFLASSDINYLADSENRDRFCSFRLGLVLSPNLLHSLTIKSGFFYRAQQNGCNFDGSEELLESTSFNLTMKF